MLSECLKGLDISEGGTYVDVTFGGGGHSREILKLIGDGKLFGFDQDPDAFENEIEDERFTLIKQNFKYLKNFLKLNRALPVSGILADSVFLHINSTRQKEVSQHDLMGHSI